MKKDNPYPYSYSNKRYKTFDYEMKKLFGCKVAKVPLDGGFTCPNIDGTKGSGGCTYCSTESLPYCNMPICEQFKAGTIPFIKKWASKDGTPPLFIPYFQTHTNTYASTERLRKIYSEALELEGAVGLSIGTRADCISDEIAGLLHEINKRTYLTVELGLQTVHDSTADRINRCHTYADFLEGRSKLEGIRCAVHIINGLPGENRDMMLQTASELAKLNPYEIKIHMLYVVRGTELSRQWSNGEFDCLSRDEYVSIVCDQLEILPPDTVIGRVTGDGLADELLAPNWSRRKTAVINEIDKELVRRESYQGKLYNIYKK